MEYLNKVMLEGRIAFEPEFKDVGVYRFVRVSLLHISKHSVTDQEFKNYITIEFWGSRAVALEGQKPKVGGFLFVDGRLKVNIWETDGEKKKELVVNCMVFQYRHPKKDDEPFQHKSVEKIPYDAPEPEDDGLPF